MGSAMVIGEIRNSFGTVCIGETTATPNNVSYEVVDQLLDLTK
jgi:hypothetical protein